MTILDTFYLLFDSDASKLDQGLKDSEGKAKSLTDALKGVDAHAEKAGGKLFELVKKSAGVLGIAASFGALAAGVKHTAEAYFELQKLAEQFRSTADAVDEFRDAAGLLGISEETAIGSLKGLDVAIQDTFLGMGRAKKVFEELGIEVTDAAGKIKPTTVVMGELAEQFKTMERGTQLRVMERLGLDASLLKLFNSDLGALQKRMAEVDRAAGFDIDRAVKRSQEYTKASKGLSLEVNTLKLYLEKLSEGFKIAAMPYFTAALKTATGYVKDFIGYLMRHSHFVEGAMIAIGAAISYFVIPAAVAGAAAVWAFLSPFLLIGAAVAAVGAAFALVYDDIMTFIEGGDSMIGHVIAKWPIIGDVVGGIVAALKGLWSFANLLWGFMSELWDSPTRAFQNFLSFVLDGIKKLLSLIPGLSSVLNLMSPGAPAGSAAATAKQALGAAGASPLAAQTSTSINNARGAKNTSVNIGTVEVKTQATDAAGISKAIGGSMQTQMRQAVNNYDDGVLA